jgi:hypothetical protein
MTVIDITKDSMVKEVSGTVRCVKCGEYADQLKGFAPKDEIFFTEYDLKNPQKVYLCDHCETEF